MKKISFILIFLSSCSLLSEPKTPIKKFVIQSETLWSSVKKSPQITLEINNEVSSQRPYIKISPYQIEYIANCEWYEDLKNMIEKSMTQSFQNAGVCIHSRPNAYSAKNIKIHVRNFGLEYFNDKKLLHVSYFVEVFEMPEFTNEKQKLFEVNKEYEWTTVDEYIKDLNHAHNDVVGQIYKWLKL